MSARYYMTAAQLRTLLTDLQDTDQLWPSEGRNLLVKRAGETVGHICFIEDGARVEWGGSLWRRERGAT